MTRTTLLRGALAVLTLIGGACGAQRTPAEDGRSDSFLVGGKTDTGGIAEGTAQAHGILALVNAAGRDLLVDEVGLGERAADNLVNVKIGDDGLVGTADDVAFTSLRQLDDVPYVGPKVFAALLAYAESHGFVDGDGGVADAGTNSTDSGTNSTDAGGVWTPAWAAGLPVRPDGTVQATAIFAVPVQYTNHYLDGSTSTGTTTEWLYCYVAGPRPSDLWVGCDQQITASPARFAIASDGSFGYSDDAHTARGAVRAGGVIELTWWTDWSTSSFGFTVEDASTGPASGRLQ